MDPNGVDEAVFRLAPKRLDVAAGAAGFEPKRLAEAPLFPAPVPEDGRLAGFAKFPKGDGDALEAFGSACFAPNAGVAALLVAAFDPNGEEACAAPKGEEDAGFAPKLNPIPDPPNAGESLLADVRASLFPNARVPVLPNARVPELPNARVPVFPNARFPVFPNVRDPLDAAPKGDDDSGREAPAPAPKGVEAVLAPAGLAPNELLLAAFPLEPNPAKLNGC